MEQLGSIPLGMSEENHMIISYRALARVVGIAKYWHSRLVSLAIMKALAECREHPCGAKDTANTRVHCPINTS